MMDISGKTAVVTAGGNGIGRSMALSLAVAGANLVIADIREDDGQAVRDAILQKGGRAIAVPTNVADRAQVEALADAAFAEFGSVEILCNNAGVAVRPFRAIWDTSEADLAYMIDINVWGVVHGIHTFVPRMRELPGRKHMVNTSSMGALVKVPGNAIYGMTKAGVAYLSDVLREELRPYDFGVTALFPGLIATEAAARSGELRPAADRDRDRDVKPYHSYAAERGETVQDVGAGRGPVTIIGGGGISVPLAPEAVGPMVVAAIRDDRAVCMTHPAPVEGIDLWADALRQGYRLES